MRTVLNIIWLILAGLWLFLAYVLAGILLCIPIITIPWAIASFRTAREPKRHACVRYRPAKRSLKRGRCAWRIRQTVSGGTRTITIAGARTIGTIAATPSRVIDPNGESVS